MITMRLPFPMCPLLACGLLLVPFALDAAGIKIELPPETAAFKPGPGAEMANGQCLVCHSVEYVTSQPPLPATFWTAEVKKMRDKYSASLPEAQVQPLVTYLTRNYGVGTNAPAAPTAADVGATAVAPNTAAASGGEAVATKYFCLSCHGISVKIVGPPYTDIAAKYKQDPQAPARIAEQIHKGGSGKWGSVVMPPFPMVTDAETKELTQWILSRR
jgi:cytochrome c551/c552